MTDDRAAVLNRRVQPLLQFFIDGASAIDGADPKWVCNFMYAGGGVPRRAFSFDGPSVVAFCSAYPFLLFPDKRRLRISQFFVFPSYQRRGIGSLLYRAVMDAARLDAQIREVTVEDPTDVFADFRLANDYRILRETARTDRLTPSQADEVRVLESFHQACLEARGGDRLAAGTAAAGRAALGAMLRKNVAERYRDCLPADRAERARVLDGLVRTESERYRRILGLDQ